MNVVRDTPSSDGACVYEVSSNYLERIQSYGPDKKLWTPARPPVKRHTIIRPVFDGRIKSVGIMMKKTFRDWKEINVTMGERI
jgi:hypothetical protein